MVPCDIITLQTICNETAEADRQMENTPNPYYFNIATIKHNVKNISSLLCTSVFVRQKKKRKKKQELI